MTQYFLLDDELDAVIEYIQNKIKKEEVERESSQKQLAQLQQLNQLHSYMMGMAEWSKIQMLQRRMYELKETRYRSRIHSESKDLLEEKESLQGFFIGSKKRERLMQIEIELAKIKERVKDDRT